MQLLHIAGVAIGVEGLTGSLAGDFDRRYARFAGDGPAELTVRVRPLVDAKHDPDTDPRIERDGRRFQLKYGALKGHFDLDTMICEAEVPDSVYVIDSLLRMTLSLVLLERDALLLHSSGVRHDGRVLVCFGPSGVGKTTTARSVPEADVLCDEIMALKMEQGRVVAHGTPFHGDLGVCAPGQGELAALVRLRQAPHDRLQRLSLAAAAREVLAATLFFCGDPDLSARLLDLAITICKDRTFSLEFALTTHVPTFVFAHLGDHPDAPQSSHARAPARG